MSCCLHIVHRMLLFNKIENKIGIMLSCDFNVKFVKPESLLLPREQIEIESE